MLSPDSFPLPLRVSPPTRFEPLVLFSSFFFLGLKLVPRLFWRKEGGGAASEKSLFCRPGGHKRLFADAKGSTSKQTSERGLELSRSYKLRAENSCQRWRRSDAGGEGKGLPGPPRHHTRKPETRLGRRAWPELGPPSRSRAQGVAGSICPAGKRTSH